MACPSPYTGFLVLSAWGGTVPVRAFRTPDLFHLRDGHNSGYAEPPESGAYDIALTDVKSRIGSRDASRLVSKQHGTPVPHPLTSVRPQERERLSHRC